MSKSACTNPKCGSSDAMETYDDGHTFCFSCRTYTRPNGGGTRHITSLQIVPQRGLTKEAETKYGILTEVDEEGTPIARHYPYPWGGWKVRDIKTKRFWSRGDMKTKGLFGADKFPPGGPAVIVVEGEEDAPAAYQALFAKYPVVSVRSSATAFADASAGRAYLNAFDKIYLALDNDEPGRKATKEIASIFDFNKVYHVNLQLKDASDYVQGGKEKEFRDLFYSAKRFTPTGVVSSFSEFRAIVSGKQKDSIGTYPFKQLNSMSYGLRGGEISLWTAQEGIGKTEVVRAIEHHLLRTTESNLAAIHLEESKFRQLAGLAGYVLERPCHLPDSFVTPEEIANAVETLCRRDDRLHLYSHFDNDDPESILDTIRFLGGSCGCSFVVLDHISQVVSGMNEKDERQTLDYLCTKLARMVEDLQFCLILVSHVNDNNQTRSSRYISKVADLRVHLHRDLEASEASERNTTYLTVLKNRFGAQTGPAGKLFFNPGTFTLSEHSIELPPVAE